MMKKERGGGDESWKIGKARLDKAKEIGWQMWSLSPTKQSYAAPYIHLKAMRGDLVDGILRLSRLRVPGPTPFHQVTVQQASHFLPGFYLSNVIQNTKPCTAHPIPVVQQPHPTVIPGSVP